MANYKTKKNILQSRDVYNRYYGDFRGVDFSSDHTQVHDQRLAYLVNMYKDYGSSQGQALETVPGFRRRVELPGSPKIHAIHYFRYKGEIKILFHAGKDLYLWHNYPKSVNIVMKKYISLPEPVKEESGISTFLVSLGDDISSVKEVHKQTGEDITINTSYSEKKLEIIRSDLEKEDVLQIFYTEGDIKESDTLFSEMNDSKSVSFIFNNRLYIIDGKNYLVYDGETVKSVLENTYIPTTYINIIPSGENADIGTEYEQRNILQPKFKHTFIANGENKVFCMNEEKLEEISEVKVYGTVLDSEQYEVNFEAGEITLTDAPKKPQDVTEGSYPEGYAGIEITAKKTFKSVSGVTDEEENIYELITACAVIAVFDGRVFFSGNPKYPNHVFYCERNNTGYADPTYFGVYNYMQDGVGVTPITGMIPVADTLMVLKGDTQQDGSVYFHTPMETGKNLQPKTYPSTQGLNGIGCLGACINFLDDPIFVSRLGVEAVGQLSVRYERAIEHRSSLVDAKLVNMDLSGAVLTEWNGYLIVLVDGKIFMADSRQRYTHEIGVMQYEWYYLDGIGIYEGQYPEYRYSSSISADIENATFEHTDKDGNVSKISIKLADKVYYPDLNETINLCGEIVNAPSADGRESASVNSAKFKFRIGDEEYQTNLFYVVHESTGEAFLCETKGNYTGGVFKKATVIKSMEDNLFFGTENGVICSFNFDMRDERGEIAPRYYAFDDRAILCGCATKMDCCGVPHLNKNTVKKSTVIKTKVLLSSAAKIKVRTNRKPYAQIRRIADTQFYFDDVDFSDFTFTTAEQSLFAVKEKEKKWVEKQYYIYSDEYMKPFALFYISFRYKISGRYKE